MNTALSSKSREYISVSDSLGYTDDSISNLEVRKWSSKPFQDCNQIKWKNFG